jgi:glyoxylase-like metal-dependent hydrolase (beta-lactamase superfamily II)
MRATSVAQFEADRDATLAPLEQVRDDVWSLPLAMPGDHIPYSLCYLLRDSDGRIHVIDPGWDSEENWESLLQALGQLGHEAADIRSIVATHLHPDHLGLADRVRRESGAPVILHEAEQAALGAEVARTAAQSEDSSDAALRELTNQLDAWGVPADRRAGIDHVTASAPLTAAMAADVVVASDQRLDIPGFELRTMWTPGHTPGHLCLRDDARSLLFTGDHLLPTIFSGLGLGGPTVSSPIADYLAGLERVSALVDHEVLPGHGYRFLGVADRAAEVAEHHLKRSRQVAEVLTELGDATTWEIASRLTWTAGWGNLASFYLYSALAQTAMHRAYVEGRSH